jgi:hypothetical protein
MEGEGMRTLESAPGAEPDGCLGRADGAHNGVDDFEAEAAAVLNGPAVAVRALVGDVFQELVDQVAIRTCIASRAASA